MTAVVLQYESVEFSECVIYTVVKVDLKTKRPQIDKPQLIYYVLYVVLFFNVKFTIYIIVSLNRIYVSTVKIGY